MCEVRKFMENIEMAHIKATFWDLFYSKTAALHLSWYTAEEWGWWIVTPLKFIDKETPVGYRSNIKL